MRTLRRDFQLRTEAPLLAERLAFLAATPEMPWTNRDRTEFDIDQASDGYLIRRDGVAERREIARETVVDYLSVQIYLQSRPDRETIPLVHAASLLWKDRRLLLVGEKACGKTTLSVQLMLNADVRLEGDESVCVLPDGLVAWPRSIRIKESSFPLLPGLEPLRLRMPSIVDFLGRRIYAFDPRLADMPWSIRQGPADIVVLVEANHGGRSWIKPIAPTQAFDRILQQTIVPRVARGAAIARLAAAFAAVPAYRLSLGDLAQAMEVLNLLADS